MKKSFVSLVGWMLTVCMLLGMMSFSAIAENAVEESIRTVFENGAGDEVYEIADGALRAVTYYSSNEEKEVTVAIAVYSGNSLKDIDFASDSLRIGTNVLRTNLVEKEAGDCVKAFLWNENAAPVETAAIYGEIDAKSIKSVVVKINNGNYKANVNPSSKEINVVVPLKYTTTDASLEAYKEHLKTAQVTIEGEYASISPASSGTFDLSKPVEFTVADENGNEDVYTLTAQIGHWTRTYNVDGASLDAGTSSWNTAYRKGAPAYLSSDKGDGVWLFSSDSVYSTVEGQLVENGINTLSIDNDSGTSNSYIHINKGIVDGATKGFALWSTGGADKNGFYSAEFKIRINSVEGSNASKAFMSVWSSNTDNILFSGTGASEGKYRLAHRQDGASKFEYVPGLELDYGKWYTIKYVYVENALPVAGEEFFGYNMELYVDGKFVDEFCHGVKASDSQNAGSLKYTGSNLSWPNHPQIAFNPYSATVIDMDIDDINVMRAKRSSDASLASASFEYDGVTYNADVNPVRNTVSFDVPQNMGTEDIISGVKINAVASDENATVAVSENLAAPDAKVTVIAADGTSKDYALKIEPSALARSYDAEGAEIDSTTLVPKTFANEEGVASGWKIYSLTSGVPTVTVPVENGNQYIKVVPNGSNHFGSIISNGNIYADKIVADIKFRLDSTEGMTNGKSYASMRSAHGESLTIDILDAEKGTYNFGIKRIDGVGAGKMVNCPTLEAGKWYDIRYIFRRYSDTINIQTPDWYATEIYIDGKFIAEIQMNASPSVAADNWHYTNAGRLSSAVHNYPEFAFEIFKDYVGFAGFSIDDLYVSYMTDWDPDSNYIAMNSKAPVAALTASNGNIAEYPVTLNPETKEATVNIIYTSIWDEAGAIAGKDWPEIHPEINNAKITLPEPAVLNGTGEASNVIECDLSEANTLTIDSVVYNLVCDFDQRFIKTDDVQNATSSAQFLQRTSSVPENYTCGEMKLSTQVKFNAFADGDTASFSAYDKAILNASSENGVIKLKFGDEVIPYTPKLMNTFRLDAVISDGEMDIYIEGKHVMNCKVDYAMVLPTNGFLAKCTGSAKIAFENTLTSVITNQLESKTVVHLLGDSVTQYYGYDETGKNTDREGWGRYFSQSFNENAVVLNHAVSGYNTNIYLNGTSRSGVATHERWSSIKRRMKAGDYLVIALHWNEENTTDGTKTEEAYKANMNKLISDAKALGVTPVVVTPAVQVTNWVDTESGVTKSKVINLKKEWAEYVREIAQDNEIVCLDLNKEIYENNWLDAYHDNGSNNNEAGWAKAVEIYNTYFYDNVHVSRAGAEFYNNAVVKLIGESQSGLKDLLK